MKVSERQVAGLRVQQLFELDWGFLVKAGEEGQLDEPENIVQFKIILEL